MYRCVFACMCMWVFDKVLIALRCWRASAHARHAAVEIERTRNACQGVRFNQSRCCGGSLQKIISSNARPQSGIGVEHMNVGILMHIRVADIIHHHSPAESVHKCLGNKYRCIYGIPSETIFHLTPLSLTASTSQPHATRFGIQIYARMPAIRPATPIRPPANRCASLYYTIMLM